MSIRYFYSANVSALAESVTSHPAHHALAISDGWDSGALESSAFMAGFALCDFITFNLGKPELIPAELQYAPAMAGADEEDYTYQLIDECYPESGITDEQLTDYLLKMHALIDALPED